MRQARKAKDVLIRNEEYRKKISEPQKYPELDSVQTLNLFWHRVKEMNKSFEMTEENRQIIEVLGLYFSQDPKFEEIGDFSLKKGIMIVGPVGCGKTTIMQAFSVNSRNGFGFTTCRKVAADYTDKNHGGITAVEKYSNLINCYPQQNFGQSQLGMCFDDLGVEGVKKHFGNETDVMSEVIFNRYENRLHSKTHFTANIDGKDIEEFYGKRIVSRLREMCNFITFSPSAPDYRK